MNLDWKPQEELTAADFDRVPVWGYDAARAAEDPDSDESWVRPWRFAGPPDESDVLFAGARLRTAKGEARRGAILFVFESGELRVAGLALLEPSFLIIGLESGKATEDDRADLDEILPGALPLTYEASLVLGDTTEPLSGTVP